MYFPAQLIVDICFVNCYWNIFWQILVPVLNMLKDVVYSFLSSSWQTGFFHSVNFHNNANNHIQIPSVCDKQRNIKHPETDVSKHPAHDSHQKDSKELESIVLPFHCIPGALTHWSSAAACFNAGQLPAHRTISSTHPPIKSNDCPQRQGPAGDASCGHL